MRDRKWIIEARHPDGSLNLDCPQPEEVFGPGAIHGMTDWEMSRVIFRKVSLDVVLTGDKIAEWPSLIDSRWKARPKW